MRKLPRAWFADDAVTLAPKLLGKIIRKGSCAGIIVETEAYTNDAASHAYHITPRSAPMRDTYGHWYVYFTYGMHHCVNITTNKCGVGAVLIRAVEPIEGIALMRRHRRAPAGRLRLPAGATSRVMGESDSPKTGALLNVGESDSPTLDLCSGPAKLCQAFGITINENLLPVGKDFAIYDTPEINQENIVTSPRIGIRNGTDLPWRFYIRDNPFVSGMNK